MRLAAINVLVEGIPKTVCRIDYEDALYVARGIASACRLPVYVDRDGSEALHPEWYRRLADRKVLEQVARSVQR